MIIVPLVLVSSLLTTFASFFLKKSTGGKSFFSVFLSYNFYLGAFLYAVQTALAIYILRIDILPYSVIVPLGALTYIWTLFVSHKFLNEKINKGKITAIALIICGVVLVSI